MYDDDDFFDSHQEADLEMAELQARGREHARRQKRVSAALAAGDYKAAAAACDHSWTQGTGPEGPGTICNHCHAHVTDCMGTTITPGCAPGQEPGP